MIFEFDDILIVGIGKLRGVFWFVVNKMICVFDVVNVVELMVLLLGVCNKFRFLFCLGLLYCKIDWIVDVLFFWIVLRDFFFSVVKLFVLLFGDGFL